MIELYAGVVVVVVVSQRQAGVAPAECRLNADGVWLGEKLKSRMLRFEAGIPPSIALLIKPLGRPIAFSFLFFGASSTSSSDMRRAPVRRMLVSCEAPALGASSVCCPLTEDVKRWVAEATEKSLGSESFAAFALASSLILAGHSFDQAV